MRIVKDIAMVLVTVLGTTLLLTGCSSTDAGTPAPVASRVEVKAVPPKEKSDKDEEVTFRDLKIDSERVDGASWSIQDGAGVLHIHLPPYVDSHVVSEAIKRIDDPEVAAQVQQSYKGGNDEPKEVPRTQAWLLKADGTAPKASSRGGSPFVISMAGIASPSLMYEFTPDAVSSAVALVIQVEEDFFVFEIKQETSQSK